MPPLTTKSTGEEGTTIAEETPSSSESSEETSPISSESTESKFNEVDTTTSSVHVTFGSFNSPHTYLPPVMSLLTTEPMSGDTDKTTPSILQPPLVDSETPAVTTPNSPAQEPSVTEPTTLADTVEHKFSGTSPPTENPTETHPSGSGEMTEASSTQNVPSGDDSTKETNVEIATMPDETTKPSLTVGNSVTTLPPQPTNEVTKSSEETTQPSDSTEDFHESHETHEVTTMAEGMTVPVVNEMSTEKKDEESTTTAKEETPKPEDAGTTPRSDETAETPEIEMTTESDGGKEGTTPGEGETVTEEGGTSPSTDEEPKATGESKVTETTTETVSSTGTSTSKGTNNTQSPADCAASSQEINVKNPHNKTIVLVTGTNRLKPKTPNRQPVSCLRDSDCSREEICKNNICTLKYVAHGMSSANRPDLSKGIILIKRKNC